MHPALVQLLRLRLRGGLRRAVRGVKSPRGALLALFSVVMFCMIAGSNLSMAFLGQRTDPEKVRTLTPLAMLGVCLASLLSAEKAVHFTMPEVEFLFPGPFRRRELLLYKLAGNAAGACFSALFLSIVFLRWASWWVACYAGILLALLFIQLAGMSLALILQWAGEYAYSRTRKVVLWGGVLLVALGARQAVTMQGGADVQQFAARFRATWPGRAMLAPFEPFGRTIAAESLGMEFLLWGAAALAIDLSLAALVLRLDSNYLEASVAASQKRYELVQRARRGRIHSSHRVARWKIGTFPWLGGAGPVAWRQSLQIVRGSPRLLLMLVIMGCAFAPGLFAMRPHNFDLTGPLVATLAWISFFAPAGVPAGFRADLDYMDGLKSLPLSTFALAAGEVAPVVAFVSLLQAIIALAVAAFGLAAAPWLLTAAAFALPLNLVLAAAENLLFLWFPSRTAPSTPGDLQFMGRQMLMMMLRMLAVAAAVGLAAGAAGLAWLAGVESAFVLGTLGWCLLFAQGMLLLMGAAAAFRRFDPSLDTP